MSNEQFTVKQHYIPQTYLRGFSADGKTVFVLDKEGKISPTNKIAINKVLYSKNLYEYKTDNGDYFCPNMNEQILGEFETYFGCYRKKLLNKRINQNVGKRSFLSTDEKAFWIAYISVQLCRTPKILNIAKELVNEIIDKNGLDISPKSIAINNVAISECLPFLEEFNEESNNIIAVLCKILYDMYITVGIIDSDLFMTSDLPVIGYGKGSLYDAKRFIFPLTSNIIIIFSHDRDKRNTLECMSNEFIKDFNMDLIDMAERYVISKKPILQTYLDYLHQKSNKRKE